MIRQIFSTLLFLALGIPSLLFGQHFLGFQNSNYAGIYGVDLQPASIVDSRIRYDANLFGYGLNLQNNYVGFLSSGIRDGSIGNINDSTQAWLIPEHRTGRDKALVLNQDIHLPSFMLALSPKHSIAVTTRFRSFLNLDQVGEPAAIFAYNDRDVPTQFDSLYNNDRLSLDVMSYGEIGLAYAGELYNDGANYLKAGIRLKYLAGVTAGYLYADRLEYSLSSRDTLNIHRADVEYAHSQLLPSIDPTDPGAIFDQLSNFGFGNTGIGADIGFVYEFRPDHEMYSSGEGEFRKPRRDLNKYKVRLGVSLLDVGRISFARDTNSVDFNGTVDGYNLNRLRLNEPGSLDSIFRSEFNFVSPMAEERFTMSLPTVLSFQADVRFSRHLYLNFTPYIAFKGKLKPNKIHASTWYSITPRFESKWLGIGAPITFTDNEGWVIGATAHLGPVVIGSSNFSNLWLKRDMRGVNAYLGFHTPIPYGRLKDKDKDGIPDKEDACPKKAGPLANQGCPEEEEEGVSEQIAENTENNSNDGIPPTERNQTTQAGSEQAGAPNTTDTEDGQSAASESASPRSNPQNPAANTGQAPAGSPEDRKIRAEEIAQAQKEAVRKRQEEIAAAKEEEERKKQEEIDKKQQEKEAFDKMLADLEAAEAAEREQRREERARRKELGLPDLPTLNRSRNQPTLIKQEEMTSVYSTGEMAIYMPFGDVDKDNVINQDDKCPQTPGLPQYKGCPEGDPRGLPQSAQSPADAQVDAFERLFFDTGSAYLNGSSRLSLNKTMLFLKDHPEVKVKIMGHTDNIGASPSNDNLSLLRAEAALDYLRSKGVAESRMVIEFYGERLPTSTNQSEDGRQRNRRIELVLFSD
ncbi:MAG: DUF5723 family protein [Bacteroidota bacterium]